MVNIYLTAVLFQEKENYTKWYPVSFAMFFIFNFLTWSIDLQSCIRDSLPPQQKKTVNG